MNRPMSVCFYLLNNHKMADSYTDRIFQSFICYFGIHEESANCNYFSPYINVILWHCSSIRIKLGRGAASEKLKHLKYSTEKLIIAYITGFDSQTSSGILEDFGSIQEKKRFRRLKRGYRCPCVLSELPKTWEWSIITPTNWSKWATPVVAAPKPDGTIRQHELTVE